MNLLLHYFLGCAALMVVFAIPSSISQSETVASVEEASSHRHPVEAFNDGAHLVHAQGRRHKRWNPFTNVGVPPFYAPLSFVDEEQEDPFTEIYRQVKEISSLVRQSSQFRWQQPANPPLRGYLPVIFVPQLTGCVCPPTDGSSTPGQEPATPAPTSPSSGYPDTTIDSRVGGTDNTDDEPEEEEEYNRKLSFDPIPPSSSTSRPPPPVEHGSSQAGLPNPEAGPGSFSSVTRQPPPSVTTFNLLRPTNQSIKATNCDLAILTCCHRKTVTVQCFEDQGCRNLRPYDSNPCTVDVIYSAVSRIYGRRTG